MVRRMDKIVVYWRAFRGICPACNSDPRMCDDCVVCDGLCRGDVPSDWMAARWLMRYFEVIRNLEATHAVNQGKSSQVP